MSAGTKQPKTRSENTDLGEIVDLLRVDASRRAEADHKTNLGQFLTSMPVARFMASMASTAADSIRILDAGAGVGSLFAAAVEHFCNAKKPPSSIAVVAYELDQTLCQYLEDTIKACSAACQARGIEFSAEVRQVDFLESAADVLEEGLFAQNDHERFNFAIQNPPYYKIQNTSAARKTLQRMGIETSNIYTGFLAVTTKLLEKNGELIAITPRSFCNGTYFRGFRKWYLQNMALQRIHSFDSRQDAFKDDAVLQETVIVHSVKGVTPGPIQITSNARPSD